MALGAAPTGRPLSLSGLLIQCGPGKTARVWLQGKGGSLKPGQALVLLPVADGETECSPADYLAPLRCTLIDDNKRHVNVVVCETDYRALKRGMSSISRASPILAVGVMLCRLTG
jgi:hypothetical protein